VYTLKRALVVNNHPGLGTLWNTAEAEAGSVVAVCGLGTVGLAVSSLIRALPFQSSRYSPVTLVFVYQLVKWESKFLCYQCIESDLSLAQVVEHISNLILLNSVHFIQSCDPKFNI